MHLDRTLWRLECVVEELLNLIMDKKQRRKGHGIRCNLPGYAPSDLLPAASSYRLKISEPPKIALPAGDQALNM
jgi:hypothetical protein